MLTRRAVITLVAAGLIGLVAAIAANRWMQGRMSSTENAGAGTAVVVAAAEIGFGEKIQANQVRVIQWPADSVPEGSFRSVNDVVGSQSNQRIFPGEALLQSRVMSQVGGSSLAMQIETNKRAVSVRVNDVIGVAGFLLPGSRVDVLATRDDKNEHRAQTRTLLQNVKVLAVDQTAQAEKDKPVVVHAVTLELDPQQAELLVQATEEGTVQLALRNPADSSVSAAALDAGQPSEAAMPAPATAAPAHRKPGTGGGSVTVIRETSVGVTEVRP